MGHVESYLANAADRAALQEINWKEEVDGKKTSMAQKPITITVRVVNTAGDTAEIVHQVN
jgi:hypothetical protein